MLRTSLIPLLLPVVSISLSAGEIHFGRDIRPLLSDRCFVCHGPDRDAAENDLRLDRRDEAIKSAIVPGRPEASELLARIAAADESLRMPPADSGRKPLTAEEIDLVRRWIAEGAEYTGHWAYLHPSRPEAPPVARMDWPFNEIDRFTLSAMEASGISPSGEADRRTLIRRLSYDLLGLPPTDAETRAFLADASPEAYERLVDRLLSSNHYGERMAMYWLDLVRYADTNGYHGDNPREVDAYRDYVIAAFNDNKPFDQFTVEQLAGDLLPEATIEQKIGSGYNRMLQTTQEGGAQAKEYLAIYQADRVRNISSVWLASTMGCCQCHDHKFDPFTLEDFYALGAFFADLSEVAVGAQPPNLTLPTPEQAERIRGLETALEDVKNNARYDAEFDAWLDEQRTLVQTHAAEVATITPTEAKSRGGANLTVIRDDSVLVLGEDPDRDVYTVRLPLKTAEPVTALRLEALTHSSFTNNSLSRANGNFVLTGVEVVRSASDGETPLTIASAQADYEQNGFPIAHAIDDDPATGWAVDGHQRAQDCIALFLFEEPVLGGDDVELIVSLRQESVFERHNIGRFRFSQITSEVPSLEGIARLSPDLTAVLKKPAGKLAPHERRRLEQGFRELSPTAAAVRKEVEKIEAQLSKARSVVRTTLVSEARDTPRMVRVLPRGNWLDDSGDVVEPAIPRSLGTLPETGGRPTRLDLARWIVADENPLTARVFVNRVWKLFFGWGLSRSLEDFGYQGDWPTHPELLDELAIDFRESGWDVKQLVKKIVMSRTYRQSSLASETLRQRDPFNRLLARQSRFRLSAEMIRDNALAVSGLLVSDIGGPSVKPYQPAGYWQHLNFPPREWESDAGPNLYRRGLYTFWCRSFLHPSLLAFDAVAREECTAERPRSNTPLQALVLLNDPTYVEAARALAGRALRQSGDDAEKIRWTWRQTLQRDPQPEELAVLLQLLVVERARYTAQPEQAREVLQNGALAVEEDLPAEELAAWTAIARALLNLHETITRN